MNRIWIPLLLLIAATSACQNDKEGTATVCINQELKPGEQLKLDNPLPHIVFINFKGSIYNANFKGLKNLEQLTLQNAQIDATDPGALCQSPKLTTLTLSNVTLKELNKDILKGCNNLKSLEIQYNSFPISKDAFSDLTDLENIHVYEFPLQEVSRDYFKPLTNLKKLTLLEAQTVKIENGAFQDLKKLTDLVLMNNKLAVISGNEFQGLSELKLLNLDFNPTTSIDIDNVMKNLPKLTQISVSYALLPEDVVKDVEKKITEAGLKPAL